MASPVRKWWKEGLVYQIWPASYKDGNGDGIGDFAGILSTLDYLQSLGVDIIWVSPAYASPQKDMGYDISDYESIDPLYGSLEDAESLIKECHARGMRVIFDLVINHTSDEHAWFQESRRSKASQKRDWYIWRPAKYDADGKRHPPNNWASIFGGSAWEWDDGSQEYYLHLFVREQPDLNWENAETRKAIYRTALRFWLERGIDGFRVDTVNMYSKRTYEDAPVTSPSEEFQPAADFYCNGPRMHEFLKEMYAEALADYDTMTVGELPHTSDPAEVHRYVSAAAKELDMVFQFETVQLGRGAHRFHTDAIPLADFKKTIAFTQQLAADPTNDAWGTAFLENHDVARSVTRFATDAPEHRARAAKLLAVLLATMSGTLFLYQGQEIGMVNAPPSWVPDEYKDVNTVNHLAEIRAKHSGAELGAEIRKAMVGVQKTARDHARTPVQWSAGKHAGFSPADAGAEPWMRVVDDYKHGWNVADQQQDPDSVLNFYRAALKLRKARVDVAVYGTFRVCSTGGDKVFSYVKAAVDGRQRILVVLNFSGEPQKLELEVGTTLGRRILGSVEGSQDDELQPWEARIYELV